MRTASGTTVTLTVGEMIDLGIHAPSLFEVNTWLNSELTQAKEREKIVATAYQSQQQSYRELEAVYSACVEDKQRAKTENAELRLALANYLNIAQLITEGEFAGGYAITDYQHAALKSFLEAK